MSSCLIVWSRNFISLLLRYYPSRLCSYSPVILYAMYVIAAPVHNDSVLYARTSLAGVRGRISQRKTTRGAITWPRGATVALIRLTCDDQVLAHLTAAAAESLAYLRPICHLCRHSPPEVTPDIPCLPLNKYEKQSLFLSLTVNW